MSKIPRHWQLSEYLPDSRYPTLADVRARNLFFRSSLSSQHTTLTVGNTVTQISNEPMRIRSVQVGTVTGGTVTVQIQVDGRDIFDDTIRPVSGGAQRDPTEVYIIPAGTPYSTIIEADSGAPSGNANVVIDIEPYALLPRFEEVKLKGKDRLRVSLRREAEFANAGGLLIEGGLIGFDKTQRSQIAAIQAAQLAEAGSARLGASGGPLPQPPVRDTHGGPGPPPGH